MNKEVPSYRIYLIYDNRYLEDSKNYRCYVGYTSKTVEERIYAHFMEARRSKSFTKKLNWLRGLSPENISYKILKDNITTLEETIESEVYFIKEAKSIFGDCLRNGDCGGYGNTKNYEREVIEKLRRGKWGNTNPTKGIENTKKVNEYKRQNPECNLSRNKILKILNQKPRKPNTSQRYFLEKDVIRIFDLWNNKIYSSGLISKEMKCSISTIESILNRPSYYSDIKLKNNLTAVLRRKHGYSCPEKIRRFVVGNELPPLRNKRTYGETFKKPVKLTELAGGRELFFESTLSCANFLEIHPGYLYAIIAGRRGFTKKRGFRKLYKIERVI